MSPVPDPVSRPSRADTRPRRFRIEHGTDHAEALQTTDGVIVGHWMPACQVDAWTDVDELREELPDARLTWIDEEPDHA